MWDNRLGKRNPRAPDFKCRDRGCDGVIWPSTAKTTAADESATGASGTESSTVEIPF
jgi:hypothetical protein